MSTTDLYDSAVLEALSSEFPFSDRKETEAKIKQRLRRKRLGVYDQVRVDRLRQLKDELQYEVGLRWKPWPNPVTGEMSTAPGPSKPEESRYYVGLHGKFVSPDDFDIPRMTADTIARYPDLSSAAIESFVPYAVAIYYLL